MKNSILGIGVDILINGHKVKQYSKDGNIFVQANYGSEYEIEIKNNNPFRIEVVVGVDGLSVINGKKHSTTQRGYVIDWYSSMKLNGWRINDEKTSAFKFTSRGNSYATSKGNSPQNGVISVTCYAEKVKEIIKPIVNNYPWWEKPLDPPFTPNPYNPYRKIGCPDCEPTWGENLICSRGFSGGTLSANYTSQVDTCCFGGEMIKSSYKPQNPEPSNHFDMGTGWGQKKDSKITYIDFERGNLLGTIEIFYASRGSLIDMGIDLIERSKIVYPKSTDEFCRPPDGWTG